MRIFRENTAALVVDYQEKILAAVDRREQMLGRSVILMNGLKALGIPMLASEQYKKGLGETLPEIDGIIGGCPHIEKRSFSCLDTPEISEALSALGKKNVILCGAEAHVCVLQTLIDLKAAGYQPIWVHDCVASRFESDRQLGLERAKQEGAIIVSSESLLFELTRTSGASEFKTISNLVK